jgi:ATP-dependent DNA helicase RecG
VDYIRVEGREWVPDPRNRYQAVEVLDPLLRAIPRVISQILDDLPTAFHLPSGADRRQEIPALPRDAIREVVVNAAMHRTYRVRGAIQIIRYANRLEIRNPGVSLVPDDRLGEPGSITRNEKIAAILHETRYAETKGTGIRAIRALMDQYELAPPFFESDREKDTFTAYFLFHHLLSAEDLAWLDGFRDFGLSGEEQRAMVYLREIGALNNALYRAINRVESQAASRDLHRLRDLGLLRQRGHGRGTYYAPSREFRATFALGPSAQSSVPAKPSEPSPRPSELAGKSSELSSIPSELAAKPGELSSIPSELSSIPSELCGEGSELRAEGSELVGLPQDILRTVALLAGRAAKGKIRAVLLRLCGVRPMTAEELGRILGRNPVSLRYRHLRPLIEDGRLRYRFPEEPTHPLQAYVTVQSPTMDGDLAPMPSEVPSP